MEIDDNAGRLYNAGERDTIRVAEAEFEAAKQSGNKHLMQAAHDKANSVRLRYVDSVTRIDFVNGGSSSISATNNTVTQVRSDGLVVQTYVKGEVAVSFIASTSAQAKIQDGELTISLTYGANGKIGASATLTGGVSVNNGGQIVNHASIGHTQQLPYFIVAEGKFSYDMNDHDMEGIIGGGLGVTAEIPMYIGDVGLSRETIVFSINLVEPVTPMHYQEWYYHLGGK